jgi:hypothetical protein
VFIRRVNGSVRSGSPWLCGQVFFVCFVGFVGFVGLVSSVSSSWWFVFFVCFVCFVVAFVMRPPPRQRAKPSISMRRDVSGCTVDMSARLISPAAWNLRDGARVATTGRASTEAQAMVRRHLNALEHSVHNTNRRVAPVEQMVSTVA